MKNKPYLILIFIFLIIIMMDVSVFAHKVNIFAYVDENEIYTESYFNDGKKCINSKIEVFNDKEVKLLEGITDDKGIFVFSIPKATYLKIVLTASAGHRAEYIISADELGDTFGSIKEKFEEPVSVVFPEISSLDLKEIQSLLEDALDKKLEPILREIKRSQEHKISPTEIIGGIGYIVGIFGIVAYFLSRKK